MLIVCPNCSTSYSVDHGSLGPAGRTVRCARCKSTWFAGGSKTAEPDLDAFVDRAIAEAQAQGAPASPQTVDDVEPAAPAPEPVEIQTAGPADESTAPSEPAAAAVPEIAAAEGTAAIQPFDDAIQVVDAPSLVPPLEHDAVGNAGAENTDAEQEDIESFAARRERLQARRKQTQSRSRWTAVFLVLLAFNVALVFGRDDVVRYLPQTASLFATIGLPVNLRHLAFEDVKVIHNTVDGIPVLLVEGKIVSKSEKPTEVPRLRFAARSAKGQELYTWTALPSRNVLGPGETLAFHSRLASPPADAADIMVRFFGSRDRIAAVK